MCTHCLSSTLLFCFESKSIELDALQSRHKKCRRRVNPIFEEMFVAVFLMRRINPIFEEMFEAVFFTNISDFQASLNRIHLLI